MANAYITPTIIAQEMMMQLDNNLVAAKLVNRDYEEEFSKIGDTVQIRRPVKYTVRTGATFSGVDTEEGNISLQLSSQKGVDLQGFSSKDMTLTIDKFSERYIKPAAIQLANAIDVDVLSLGLYAGNWVGTPGTGITTIPGFFRGPQRLDENGVPADSRTAILNPSDYWGMAGNITGTYIDPTAKDALTKGKLPMLGNIDAYMSQNAPSFTTGARGGTPVINGASQNVTYAASKSTWTQTLNVNGASNSITNWANAGDVFTIAGVYDVNPTTRATLTRLKQFTITAAASSSGAGALALTITPPIIASGPQQNVSAAPANSAAVTMLGSASTVYPFSLAFHKNAFALAVRPLDIPMGAPPGSKRITGDGISIRMIPIYDGTNDVSSIRFDVLYGVKALFPELATRMSG